MAVKTFVQTASVALFVLLALVAAAPADAQSNIAVINTQQIVAESETGKRALEGLRALQEQKEQEGRTRQEELNELRNRLNEGRLSLAEDKLRELQDELETKARELRRFQEDAASELEKRQTEVLGEIEQKVMPIINQIGQEEGYSMIFRKFESGLVYVDDAVDITQQVIERLDAGAGAASSGE